MADEDFDDDFEETFDEIEEEEPDLDEELEDADLDAEVLEVEFGEAIGDEIDVDVEAETEEEGEEEELPLVKKRRAAEDEDEDEELIDPDDVEADLDTILKDRIAAGDDESEEDEEETTEAETGPDSGDRVLPRRADEFVCESCFLVKHVSQRVGLGNLCRDCV